MGKSKNPRRSCPNLLTNYNDCETNLKKDI